MFRIITDDLNQLYYFPRSNDSYFLSSNQLLQNKHYFIPTKCYLLDSNSTLHKCKYTIIVTLLGFQTPTLSEKMKNT